MVSFELIEQIDSLLCTLQSDNYLIQVLPILSGAHDRLLAISASAFVIDSQRDDSSKLDSRVRLDKKANALLKRMMDDIKGISPKKLFVGIEELKKELGALNSWQTANESKPLSMVQTKLQHFSDSYEHFITRTYNYPDAVDTLLSANALKLALESTVDLLGLVRENMEGHDLREDGRTQAISIFLESDFVFSTFIRKLSCLEKIYLELCELLAVSPNDPPLQIVKVESGSLWVKLFGESKVIALMTSSIQSAAQYFYRNYTKEGQDHAKEEKILAIPKRIESVRSILDFATELKRSGSDTVLLKEQIDKSSILIAQQLNQLLVNEPSITVNENYYSVGITARKGLLSSPINLLSPGATCEGLNEET